MVSWNHQKDPGKAHEAYAAQRNQGGKQHVPDTAQSAGEYLNKYEDDIAGRDIAQHIDSDLNDIDICRKDVIQRAAEDHEEDQKCSAYAERHSETDSDTSEYTVVPPCAVILAGKCCDRDAECPAYGPEYSVQLAVCRPCCGRVRAEAVHGRLYDDIGNPIHAGLKPAWETDAKLCPQHSRRDADGGRYQFQQIIASHQRPCDQNRADGL